jgi:uncharacterized membrane protein YsdA (DUF1294 family)/cold shock CspA family protein
MRQKGKIKSWNSEKAYGFITPLTEGRDVFIHIKAFANRNRTPLVGDLVTYTLDKDQQGRACAINAIFAGETLPKKSGGKGGSLLAIGLGSFALITAISALLGKTPIWLPCVYWVMSGITFLVYWKDKAAAQKDKWRTPESTLHLLALIGGWPGAMLAQSKLRHKSKKREFRATFWVTVLVNCGFYIWLHMDGGIAFQRTFLGM